MSFTSPIAGLVAAALLVPPLVLLYVLRLKRRPVTVPSTFLWPGVREDLEVNVPWRRLRLTGLFVLQLVALVLLLLALAGPVLDDAALGGSGRTIVLLDRSASMRATDVPAREAGDAPRRRFDVALDAVRAIVDRRARGGGEVMIVAYDARAEVIAPFDRRPAALRAALDGLEATDAEADLEAALRLAEGFVRGTGTGEEAGAGGPVDVLVVSDGTVAAPGSRAGGGPGAVRPGDGGAETFGLPGARVELRLVGPADPASARNLGIVAFDARRDDVDPERVRAFVRVLNAGPDAVETTLRLAVDAEPALVRRLEVPAAAPDGPPGEASVVLDVEAPAAALLTALLDPGDPLPADDAATLRLPPPARPAIVVVAPRGAAGGDATALPILLDLLEGVEPRRLDVLGPAAYERLRADGTIAERYDLVVLDRVAGVRLPPVPSVGFGARPAGIDRVGDATDATAAPTPAPDPERGRRVLAWSRDDPLLRYVALDEVSWSGFVGWVPPPGARTLAEGPDGPVILAARADDATHVLVGFALDRSNWAVDLSIAVFVQNAVDRLAATGGGQPGVRRRPSEPVTVRPIAGRERLEVRGPAERTVAVRRDAGPVSLPPFERAGTYRVEGAQPPDDLVAVSVLSAVESDLRPRPVLRVNAETARARAVQAVRGPQDLRPWLLAAFGLVLLAEWLAWCRLTGPGGR